MFFVVLIRFLTGYVTFYGREGFTERFINLCSRDGIPLWNLKSDSGGFCACTTIKGYKNIRSAARRSGVRLKIRTRNGLPFFLDRYKYRWGMVAGALFFVMMLSFLSTRIWYVEVSGNERFSSASIIEVFDSMGVSIGKRKKDIDTSQIQLKAYTDLPDFSWIAINLDGSTARIEVREKVPVPEIADDKTPCNIKAAQGGQILSIKVYEGKGEVKQGDAVAKGDLLINGITENEDGTPVFHHAKGEVIAKTVREIEVIIPNKIKCRKYTGYKSTGYTVLFFGFEIPIKKAEYPQGEYEEEIKKTYAYAGKTKLPLGIIRNTVTVTSEAEEAITAAEAGNLAAMEFQNQYEELKSKAKILSENIESGEYNSGWRIKGTFICEENIAVEEKFEISQESE